MSQYRGRHRAQSQSPLFRHPAVPAAAVATVAVAAGSAAVIAGQSPAAASAVSFMTAGQLDAAPVQDRVADQQTSRSNARASATVVARAQAVANNRAQARSAALAKAEAAKAQAKKKAALSALSISVTAAADPTKPRPVESATSGATDSPAASSPTPARGDSKTSGAPSSSNVTSASGGWTCAISSCGGNFTSGFGYRSEFGAMHLGDDFSVGEGTPLHAMHTGTIVAAGPYGGMGNRIQIDFGNGISATYAHLSSITSSVGQQVAAGQVIGYSGNTGHSTGPHLHLEIHIDGVPVNPQPWLRAHGIF